MSTRRSVRILLVLVVVGVLGAAWFALQVDPIFSQAGKEVNVTVHYGDSLSTIASELHSQGVIASPLAFRLDILLFGSPLVRAGQYGFRQGSSFASVRAILTGGPNLVNVAPGLTLREVERSVQSLRGSRFAHEFFADLSPSRTSSPFASGTSLEGLIGAGTYVLFPSTTPGQLARAMVRGFTKEAGALGLRPSTKVGGLDAYQLITAASIVQKEGYYSRNMPKVARVIFNRLARGGPLQMDATVLYFFARDGGTVTPAMLATPTPYNTYLNPGLTPTPICTVSPVALDAVLHAPAGPWLYFTVINKRGDEAFSTTFAQQLKNEQIASARGIS